MNELHLFAGAGRRNPLLDSCLECGHCVLGQFCMLSDRHIYECKQIPDWCKLEDAYAEDVDK